MLRNSEKGCSKDSLGTLSTKDIDYYRNTFIRTFKAIQNLQTTTSVKREENVNDL
jgi:hypothetical protein